MCLVEHVMQLNRTAGTPAMRRLSIAGAVDEAGSVDWAQESLVFMGVC